MPPKKYKQFQIFHATNTPNLVIVESPGKINKIRSYLGPGYTVEASIGHIMDLDDKVLSVDLDTMTPSYIIPDRSKGTVERILNATAIITIVSVGSHVTTKNNETHLTIEDKNHTIHRHGYFKNCSRIMQMQSLPMLCKQEVSLCVHLHGRVPLFNMKSN